MPAPELYHIELKQPLKAWGYAERMHIGHRDSKAGVSEGPAGNLGDLSGGSWGS
jgi:hypothetical protein